MYKNTNRRLVAWGAVFRAYLGLDIVDRAGVVHSNVDPLSRLKRILPHQSPVVDLTLPIQSQLPEQPLVSWEDSLERVPVQKATFLMMRAQAKGKVQGEHTTLERQLEKEMAQAAWKWGKATNPPGGEWLPQSLSITISPDRLKTFVQGYKEDPSFRCAWEGASLEGSEVSAAQRFYKSDEGLLMFRDASWVARLCVPRSEVQQLL